MDGLDAVRPYVAEIDGALADTAAFCAAYAVEAGAVGQLRGGGPAVAATPRRWRPAWCSATDRADVNKTVRKHLGLRKISFAAMDDAVSQTSMEFGGITAIGLPDGWPVLVDAAVIAQPWLVIGSGLRRSKIAIRGADVASLLASRCSSWLSAPADSSSSRIRTVDRCSSWTGSASSSVVEESTADHRSSLHLVRRSILVRNRTPSCLPVILRNGVTIASPRSPRASSTGRGQLDDPAAGPPPDGAREVDVRERLMDSAERLAQAEPVRGRTEQGGPSRSSPPAVTTTEYAGAASRTRATSSSSALARGASASPPSSHGRASSVRGHPSSRLGTA